MAIGLTSAPCLAMPLCESFFTNKEFEPGSFSDFIELKNTTYIFAQDGIHILSTNNQGKIISSQVYSYGSEGATHLDIIRRQIGEDRFNELMKSRNPEKALDNEFKKRAEKSLQASSKQKASAIRRQFARYNREKLPHEELIDQAQQWIQEQGFNSETHTTWIKNYLKKVKKMQHFDSNVKVRQTAQGKEKIYVKELPIIVYEIPYLLKNGETQEATLWMFAQNDLENGRMAHSSLLPIAQQILPSHWRFLANGNAADIRLVVRITYNPATGIGSYEIKNAYYKDPKYHQIGSFQL